MYVATVNTPGYLPWDDDPRTFETAQEAWAYLLEERDRALDAAWDEFNVPVNDEAREALADEWARAADPDRDSTGTVYGPTPGYDGNHDLGLAYSVTLIEEEPEPDYPGVFFVNVYEITRQYGGPEEGGWWYDTGRFITGRLVSPVDDEDAQRVAEALSAEYPHTRKRYSVLGGEDYDVLIENHPGKDFPEEIPHYE